MATKQEIIDHMLRRITDAYKKDPTTNWYKLIEVLADSLQEFEDIDLMFSDIQKVHFSLTTTPLGANTGVNLDLLGSMFGMIRIPGETDTQYRARLLDYVANFERGGTYDSMINYLYYVLGILGWVGSKSNILIADNYDDPPGTGVYGHITVVVGGDHTGMSENILVTPHSGTFWDEANRIKAAAIKIDGVGGGLIEEWGKEFEETLYISPGDFHIPEERVGGEFVDENHIFHWTEITFTDSLNVTS